MVAHPATEALASFWAKRALLGRLVPPTVPKPGSRILSGPPDRELVNLVVEELVRAGLDRSAIRTGEVMSLPGAYNPAPREWDLLVVEDGIPVAAVGFRADDGESVGKNFNYRVKEVLGDAVNLGRPYEPEALTAFKPCLALLFVTEDCASMTAGVRVANASFGNEFGFPECASYEDMYGIVFERLIQDGRYDAICYLASTASDEPKVREPREEMSFGRFARSIADRVAEIRKLRHASAFDAVEFGRKLAQRDDLGKVVHGITSTPQGLTAAEAAVIGHRRRLVARLRELALIDDATETAMQNAIGTNYWIFGGQYVGIAARRTLMPLDQHDIPLLCADRSLHIVELKGPASRIVRKHRNHLIVADEVHEAVSQCMNYLRSFDDLGPALQTVHSNECGFDYDYRRVKGSVVIGHQDRALSADVTREQVDQTIRSYNAHLSRVQVVTYDDLLDSADRALNFEIS
ncbi:Shedu anti-phage system protein SduA domain-containing protein [Amycolatopsis sp. cg13]|uniref:Shedu anti-phage system protein SduA domain-containing protein n=1 Tax=Amycolatopsis sp. cg13 TaxID=3238807 RepID=UPI003523F445